MISLLEVLQNWTSEPGQLVGVAWDLSQLSSLRPDLKTVVQISKHASVVAPPGWGRETAPLPPRPLRS